MGERECPICVDYLRPGEKIVQLACHELHKMHESCFRNFLDTNARMNQPQLNRCPFCMKPIVEAEVKKKKKSLTVLPVIHNSLFLLRWPLL